MKANEFRKKSTKDLKKERIELLREHFNLRMQKVNEQLSRHTQLKMVKRDIARINTILKEKKASDNLK
ncbi:MAG: 50S ribosomal protein L29 [Gammaproteobacteria bacterium]|nr:MAG: 50S ribosomal protein L29 [Gammaproteobacteria bacterium]RKZ44447.1 MAG: 50S ribosomal protein L29 [Gammaproteobacteria bacterium]RKZ76565.1 MAG: 50S ribosomal protein L29 [Gammaproteobacteria bacterium]